MKYLQFFEKRIIHRREGIPYLIRWTLLGIGEDSRWFSIKIHNILVNDEECLHNHPWAFISIILKGSYTEFIKVEPWSYKFKVKYKHGQPVSWSDPVYSEKNGFNTQHKLFRRGNILFRSAHWSHRLQLGNILVPASDGEGFVMQPIPVWTLVFTFKKIQNWGFFTKNGWIPWWRYSEEKYC